MSRVFVFGTLKRGFPLHAQGLRQATYLGRFRTLEAYPMMVAGPWYAPMMLNEPGNGLSVVGEMYEVGNAELAVLDKLESVGTPGNLRIAIHVAPLAGGPASKADAYMKSASLAEPRHSPFLSDYQDRRALEAI